VDRRRLWPDFRDARVLFDDADLVVIDKPAGAPCAASAPGVDDDIASRLRRFLGAPYVAPAHALDREASGVLVLSKRRESNRPLAEALESSAEPRVFVAVVAPWAAAADKLVLRHWVAPDREGTLVANDRPSAKAREAVTHVTTLERSGERALVELRIERGRAHQLRPQLARAGSPIAGDRLYGGAVATTLMLHAARLAIRHPRTTDELVVGAPVPEAFARALAQGPPRALLLGDRAALDDALGRALEARWALGHAALAPEPTTAFRLLNDVGDGVPDLAVDVYGDHFVAHFYDDDGRGGSGTAARRDAVLDALHALGPDGVYVKIRPRQANVVDAAERDAWAPRAPARGSAAPDEIVVMENGLPFYVRLGDGLSTGVFLDQRDNRRRVREMAGGARVLNLFAYTCAFSVAAAAGGARATLSIDVSQKALEWGERNLRGAGIAAGDHRFVAADVLEMLASLRRGRAQFEVVVVDPPTYASTRATRFASSRDWGALVEQVLHVVAPGGRVLACSNDRRMARLKMRRLIHEAARRSGRAVAQVKDLSPPSDFPAPPGEEAHPKSLLVTLAEPPAEV